MKNKKIKRNFRKHMDVHIRNKIIFIAREILKIFMVFHLIIFLFDEIFFSFTLFFMPLIRTLS